MQSHQKEKSASNHFFYGTVNLGLAGLSAALVATFERLNREDSWFRKNNDDSSNAFLTMSVYLVAAFTAVNLGGVAYNYGLGLFKVSPCKRNNQVLDTDLETAFQHP